MRPFQRRGQRLAGVRGTVVGDTEEGANEQIDVLARIYMDVDRPGIGAASTVCFSRIVWKSRVMFVLT